MSKNKHSHPVEGVDASSALVDRSVVSVNASVAPPSPPVPSVAPAVSERLSEADKLSLDLARSKRLVALAEAKTALANNENAELNYKYLVLQVYMKYGLTADDALSEAGDIIRGGAKNMVPKQ